MQDDERRQSGLFSGIGAAGGLLVQLPLIAATPSSAAATVAGLTSCLLSSALFGVIWRYVVRNDKDAADLQLKVHSLVPPLFYNFAAGSNEISPVNKFPHKFSITVYIDEEIGLGDGKFNSSIEVIN